MLWDALGTRTKFQLEILTINVISGIVYFRKIILESSQNVSETTLLSFRVTSLALWAIIWLCDCSSASESKRIDGKFHKIWWCNHNISLHSKPIPVLRAVRMQNGIYLFGLSNTYVRESVIFL